MHAECTRTALVFSFHMQVQFWRDFEHFGGKIKIHENFSDVALVHRNEDSQKHYRHFLSTLLIHIKRVLSMVEVSIFLL